MILCIDTTKLSTSKELQRVNLKDILENDIKYFECVEDALKERYIPLDFSVSVRSMYSNLVLQKEVIENDELVKFLYYTNLVSIEQLPHKGYDLVMYLASIGLMQNINYTPSFDRVMFEHSQIDVMGIYNPDPEIINPIIYSHIIISDEGVKEFSTFLKKGVSLVPIKDLVKTGNITELTDTLIEVKEENKNEQ